MRAVAVVAVVLYHANVVGGGFVGVDVFFVLSGFLITRLLWREISADGRVSFSGFYGRRARRLLPASALVLVATVLGALIWVSPLAARSVVSDAKAAALYVANYRFIAQRTNYLATQAPSPLQHYWSLAVEEQFYLMWPLLLLGLTRLTRRRVGALWWTLLGIAVVSFWLSWHWTSSSQAWAFFSLPSRAWELMAGALIAFGAAQLSRLRPSVAATLTWCGLAAIVWSVFAFSASTEFPGTAALVPVLGTVAVLVGGCAAPRRGARTVLDRSPCQFLGRLSYSWYLWHWPVLVFAAVIAGHALTRVQNVGLVLVSAVLAYLTLVFLERPIRMAPRLTGHARASLAVGATATLAALVGTAMIAASLPSLRGTGRAVALATPKIEAPAARAVTAPLSATATTIPVVTAALLSATHAEDVPVNLSPSLGDAARDKAEPFLDGCDNTYTDVVVHRCVYGDPHGTKTIVIFGDSHAAMYQPGFDLVARLRHWRLIVLSKATCPPFSLPIFSPVLGRSFSECDEWRNAALARIAAEHPAVVILSSARHYGPEYHFRMYSPEWTNGISDVVRRLRTMTPHVVVFSPTPRPPGDVPGCLSAHLNNVGACAMPLDQAVPPLGFLTEQQAAVAGGGEYFDVTSWLCTATTCPPIVGNLLVYRDDNHITTKYSLWLAAPIARFLDATLSK